VLLAAHERGLAGYWRTPGVLRSPTGWRHSGSATTSGSSRCCIRNRLSGAAILERGDARVTTHLD
jgi:hypothetical protein